MEQKEIGFIGVGNMAGAIIEGILGSGFVQNSSIGVLDKSTENAEKFKAKGCTNYNSINALVEASDFVILAVKPQQFEEIMPELKESIKENTVVVSIAAGITSDYIKERTNQYAKIVLVMPNTPLLVGKGATVMARIKPTTKEEFAYVKEIFETAGIVEEIAEDKINTSIPVHGSSPAFIYYFAECMIKSAVELGFEEEMATRLVLQTMAGSAEMLMLSGKTPRELIDMVCSPGGTTLAGMAALEVSGFPQAVENAFSATIWRGRELAGGRPTANDIDVRTIEYGSEDYNKQLDLRYRVMREPLGLEFSEEELERDKVVVHVCAFKGQEILGTAQLQLIDAFTAKVTQVAVDQNSRNFGVGAMVMAKIEEIANEKGASKLTLNARISAKPFYMRLGYQARGDEFLSSGLPHVAMHKNI